MKQHKARKRFGQNFLQDQSVISGIAAAIAPQASDCLVEIGPGQGALTRPLFDSGCRLTLIELDRDLIPLLNASFTYDSRCDLIQSDVLKVDFSRLHPEQPLRVVGNLPYNISTPLIFHLLETSDRIRDMHFMLQREVVQRLTAEPGTKHWGRLSIMSQYYCQAECLFEVPPEAFDPAPKVWSAVVRLTPHTTRIDVKSVELLEKIVRVAFNMRRKTLRNALKELVMPDQFTAANIDPMLRPENLSLEDFARLSNLLAEAQ